MSEPVEKRRPMIDLDEFERRLRLQFNADPVNEAPVAEFSGLADGQNLYGRGSAEPKASPMASFQNISAQNISTKDISPRDFRIGGDFAAIEAGLLGSIEPSPDARIGAARSEALSPLRAVRDNFSEIEAALLGGANEPVFALKRSDESELAGDEAVKPLSGLDPSERYMIAGGVSDRAGADEETRSRRTLYIMAAIVVVGLGGIIAKFESGFAGGAQPAQLKAEISPDSQQTHEAMTEKHAPDAALASSDEAGATVAADAVRVASGAEAAVTPAVVAAPLAETAPSVAALAPANADVSSLSSQSESSLSSQSMTDTPHSFSAAKPAAALIDTPAAAPAPLATPAPALSNAQAKPAAPAKSAAAPIVKAAAAKPAHPAPAPKQAAADRAKANANAQTAHAAIKPKPVAHAAAERPTQTAEALPEQTASAPVQAANPAVTGVSSIMQMAVNSVNNAVKMFDWRRHDAGANP
ncbi:hypothetical protein [Methylocapsa palsarum]|uniref:Uncharacterized protein n=1 Tax=Methylocapsa palsarum TaxID=1612308 RepID=A0A1I3XF34_9HYPH|nr:hypothetical protein [Methylocapsa palsarum]SFK18144.1 hypothetical protein SAMN05444581_10382 [Methylocapsa palsarum]